MQAIQFGKYIYGPSIMYPMGTQGPTQIGFSIPDSGEVGPTFVMSAWKLPESDTFSVQVENVPTEVPRTPGDATPQSVRLDRNHNFVNLLLHSENEPFRVRVIADAKAALEARAKYWPDFRKQQ